MSGCARWIRSYVIRMVSGRALPLSPTLLNALEALLINKFWCSQREKFTNFVLFKNPLRNPDWDLIRRVYGPKPGHLWRLGEVCGFNMLQILQEWIYWREVEYKKVCVWDALSKNTWVDPNRFTPTELVGMNPFSVLRDCTYVHRSHLGDPGIFGIGMTYGFQKCKFCRVLPLGSGFLTGFVHRPSTSFEKKSKKITKKSPKKSPKKITKKISKKKSKKISTNFFMS